MRRLVWAIMVLAVVWCAWWAAASAGLHYAITNWFENQQKTRLEADISEISQHGFPFDLHARLQDVSVADATTGVSADVPEINLHASAYWPGFIAVKLPDAPLKIETPTGRYVVTAKDAQADLRLHPGVALQLQNVGVVSGPWQIETATDGLVSAQNLKMTMTQAIASDQTYHIHVNATKLKPGDVIRRVLAVPPVWPAAFDAFTADLDIVFDVPWDRTTLITQRPQPRAISVRQVEVIWGDVQLSASGDLSIDPSGVPLGELSMTLTNWRRITALAAASGALPDAQLAQAEIVLSALANMQGGQNDLDLTLSFKDSEMVLGPIRLGPAPRLILH